MPIVRLDLDPALCLPKPAVDYAAHSEPALTEPESKRFRLTVVARAALDSNRHGPRYRCEREVAFASGTPLGQQRQGAARESEPGNHQGNRDHLVPLTASPSHQAAPVAVTTGITARVNDAAIAQRLTMVAV